MKNKTLNFGSVAVAALALACSFQANAKVSAADAAKLGTDLTCVGAVKGANADGTIPAFSGKWVGSVPGNSGGGAHPVNPFKGEKPLFTITAANMGKYASKLSDGQKAMLKKYSTYSIPVYKTHRESGIDSAVCAATKKNATGAELAASGLTVSGATRGGFLFPIPKTGAEVLWNSFVSNFAVTEVVDRDTAVVDSKGDKVWSRSKVTLFSKANSPEMADKPLNDEKEIGSFVLAQMKAPAKVKGLRILVNEPLSHTQDRRTWMYDPGTRRVRQAPDFGFDQPLEGTANNMTIDEDRLFNGSPKRYNFKLIGSAPVEMYVPSNGFAINEVGVKYDELLTPNHENPKFMRYELRRVWKVEATLKSGFRHLYAKRVMYFDEDTWRAVMADYYDAKGAIWKHNYVTYYHAPEIKGTNPGASFYHDLVSNKYVAYNLFQERSKAPVLNKGGMTEQDFTPTALKQLAD